MRNVISAGVSLIMATVLVVAAVVYRSIRSKPVMATKQFHVVLIGASIGQGWHLAEWPARVRALGFTAESIAVWQFDKTEAVNGVLKRPSRQFKFGRSYIKSLFAPPPQVPNLVILKECSSYFPGPRDSYRDMVRTWVRQLLASKKQVMLATVIPVTAERAKRDTGKQESLTEYNRWIREFARSQSIPLIDLDSSLRVGGEGSFLREEFASPDGSHISARGYAVLDQTLKIALCEFNPGATVCAPATASAQP